MTWLTTWYRYVTDYVAISWRGIFTLIVTASCVR